jgi:hypothetical protein
MKKGFYRIVKLTRYHSDPKEMNEEIDLIIEDEEDKNWVLEDCKITETSKGQIAMLLFNILWEDE